MMLVDNLRPVFSESALSDFTSLFSDQVTSSERGKSNPYLPLCMV